MGWIVEDAMVGLYNFDILVGSGIIVRAHPEFKFANEDLGPDRVLVRLLQTSHYSLKVQYYCTFAHLGSKSAN